MTSNKLAARLAVKRATAVNACPANVESRAIIVAARQLAERIDQFLDEHLTPDCRCPLCSEPDRSGKNRDLRRDLTTLTDTMRCFSDLAGSSSPPTPRETERMYAEFLAEQRKAKVPA